MKIRIFLPNFYIAVYTVVMMLGNFISNPLLSLMHHGIAALAFGILLWQRYKPTKFVVFMSAYILFLLADTYFVNGFLNIYTVIAELKIILFVATLDMFLQRASALVAKGMMRLYFVMVLINTLLMIVMPNGVIQNDVVVNQWTTVHRAVWPLGNNNSMVGYYITLLVLLLWNNKLQKRRLSTNLTVIILTAVGIVLSSSSTSLVVMLIVVLAVIYGLYTERESLFKLNIKLLYIAYAVIFVLLISGAFSAFNSIIDTLFEKDATFTSRSDIWEQVVEMIAYNPVFGWGYISGEEAAQILGAANFTSAHNQILQTLWQAGIVGLLILISVYVYVGKRILKIKNNRLKNAITIFVFALQVELLFETAMTRFDIWTYLLVCYSFAEYIIRDEKAKLSEVQSDENMQ